MPDQRCWQPPLLRTGEPEMEHRCSRVKWKEVAVGPNSTRFKGGLGSPASRSLCVFVCVSGSFIKIQILASEFLLTDERMHFKQTSPGNSEAR